jgi:peptidoglycan hydrolase-like protein with peptidoglycan-binding domain
MAGGTRASLRVVAVCIGVASAIGSPAAASAARMGSSSVAALQVALRAKGLYSGTIDGFAGPATRAGVRAVQRRAGIAADGVAGPQTLHALGRRGRPPLGSRMLHAGARGYDVAQLQFLLAWHGFPSATIDGGFGPRTKAAVIRFQRWARVSRDGIAGPTTIRLVRSDAASSPVSLARPIAASTGDTFGPRGNRFHPGLDYPAASGTPVYAARSGRVTWASWWAGGYGDLVSIAHGRGVRTLYAHLSSITVRRGQRVATGALVGRVGSTGLSTGPHLHFELRLRGAAIDPATGL